MFDKVEIRVNAGRGGDGKVGFRREKFAPLGGPDGGDGGDGGDVVVRAGGNITSLINFQYRSVYRAGHGGNGSGQRKHGKNGSDLILDVPVGVTVSAKTQLGDDTEIYDLVESGQYIVIATGGRGGQVFRARGGLFCPGISRLNSGNDPRDGGVDISSVLN